MQISINFIIILISLFYYQSILSLNCWEEAFIDNNKVFIDITNNNNHVMMGYLSQININNYQNITVTGMPLITPSLLMEKCDKLGIMICAAVQFFHRPGLVLNNLSQDWGNFLTHEEFITSRRNGITLPMDGEVQGIAYKRKKCFTPIPYGSVSSSFSSLFSSSSSSIETTLSE